jgi:uncharacterized glyoxalase superfamily metalloenzyme YdcJ
MAPQEGQREGTKEAPHFDHGPWGAMRVDGSTNLAAMRNLFKILGRVSSGVPEIAC